MRIKKLNNLWYYTLVKSWSGKQICICIQLVWVGHLFRPSKCVCCVATSYLILFIGFTSWNTNNGVYSITRILILSLIRPIGNWLLALFVSFGHGVTPIWSKAWNDGEVKIETISLWRKEKNTYREIIAASCSEFASLSFVFDANGVLIISSFLLSLRLKILLIEKLVKPAFVFPCSDDVDSLLDGLKLARSLILRSNAGDRFLIGVDVIRSRDSLGDCGDGSGLETTSISSSCSWIDIILNLYWGRGPKIFENTQNLRSFECFSRLFIVHISLLNDPMNVLYPKISQNTKTLWKSSLHWKWSQTKNFEMLFAKTQLMVNFYLWKKVRQSSSTFTFRMGSDDPCEQNFNPRCLTIFVHHFHHVLSHPCEGYTHPWWIYSNVELFTCIHFICCILLYSFVCASRSHRKGTNRTTKRVSGCNLFSAFVCFIVISIVVLAGFLYVPCVSWCCVVFCCCRFCLILG